MPRTTVPLLFGAGLDRATGVLARDGRAGNDFRNVYLYRDKAQVRRGHAALQLLRDEVGAPLEDVLLVQALESEQVGVVAGYGSDGRVHLFRASGDGSAIARIGVAFTVPPAGHQPPRLLACEQYRKLFVAHDEPGLFWRQPTTYYNPFGAPAIGTLTADLDGDSVSGPVQFRGVGPYLQYLVGWGFGTETDQDRPEVVRVSHPDNPLLLDPDDYFLAGKGGTPVLNCLQAGLGQQSSVLMILKSTEIHRIFGYDKRTFGIEQIESGHGIPTSRLAYSLNGIVYFWDIVDGPRRSSGGPSEDLSWPLDLQAPEPADLVAAGAVADGFCCWLPSRRCLKFIFGRREYQLSLWDPAALKWSYNENGFDAQSAGVLYQGFDVASTPPTGAASGVSIAQGGDDATLHVTWQNNGLTGGEVAEVWVHRVTLNAWEFAGAAAAENVNQALDVPCKPGTLVEAQVRYRRGASYGAGYEGGDPSAWPAGSLSNQMTTGLLKPVIAGVWSRTSSTTEQIVLDASVLEASLPTKVWKAGPVLLATLAAGVTEFVHTAINPEADNEYWFEQDGDDATQSSDHLHVWGGPAALAALVSLVAGVPSRWTLIWTNGDLVDPIELWAQLDGVYLWKLRKARPAGEGNYSDDEGAPGSGKTFHATIRYKVTAFGVDDWSAYAGGSGDPSVGSISVVLN